MARVCKLGGHLGRLGSQTHRGLIVGQSRLGLSKGKSSIAPAAKQIGYLIIQCNGFVVVFDGRFVVALSEVDFTSVVESLDKLGIQFNGLAKGTDGIREVTGDRKEHP